MINNSRDDKPLYKALRIDCANCFGFCCAALYFSASEGFPADKEAGKSCSNLQDDFSCSVHRSLREKGLKGCTAYDCFGAGQKVAQVTFNGRSWKQDKQLKLQMFEAFLIMRQLHEMLWYLTEALSRQPSSAAENAIQKLIIETERLTQLDAASLLLLDLESHRSKVNCFLHQTSEFIRNRALTGQKPSQIRRKTIAGRLNLIGADLRKTQLKGADLRGALLIGANLQCVNLCGADLIGADLRDADLRSTDLTDSLFVTQSQINTAKGNSKTKLPPALSLPSFWED